MIAAFTSSRLLYRPFTMNDAQFVYQLNSDRQVLTYLQEEPMKDIQEATTRLQESILPQYQQYGYGRWAVHQKESLAFMGWCGLKYRIERNETDLGYRFLPEYWGAGYATEAAAACIQQGFAAHALKRITAVAAVGNRASIKILKKIGMQFTGFQTIDNQLVESFEIINHF